jgi:hypothetical protein
MQALVALLNARAMLGALDTGALWPQAKIADNEVAATRVAHRPLQRPGPFDSAAIDAAPEHQYRRLEDRRRRLREDLSKLIEDGLPNNERDARALADAAQAAGENARTLLAAAKDQLVLEGRAESGKPVKDGSSTIFDADAVAEAFVSLMTALREGCRCRKSRLLGVRVRIG